MGSSQTNPFEDDNRKQLRSHAQLQRGGVVGGVGVVPPPHQSNVIEHVAFIQYQLSNLHEAFETLHSRLADGGVLNQEPEAPSPMVQANGPVSTCRLSNGLHDIARQIEAKANALNELRRSLGV